MVHSLYQSLNNLETIYADRIGIRYYDEAKGGVVEVPFRQYAADLRRFWHFCAAAPRTPWDSVWPSWPATATTM